MKKVIIYPGRFQPMLSHHAEVFKQLSSQFPDADIYVGTSDKVEAPKSPFNFKEKQLIAQAHGVPADKVLMAGRPYHKDDYAKYFDENNTIIIFAVGEKDLDRFPFGNVDSETGLDMTVKGEPRPKYYQKIDTLQSDPRPMAERGYITLAPTIMTGDEVASASAFRQALIDAPDQEAAKAVFQKQFGNYDEKIFNLIYSKVTGANMTENINTLRRLAGLPVQDVQEAAPVVFNADVDPKQAKFSEPTKTSSKYSIANRFPKGSDVNDIETKKAEFVKALQQSPDALLSEINERLDPRDDTSLAIGQKLYDISAELEKNDGRIAALPKEMKQFVLELTMAAVMRMQLVAGDDSPVYSDDDEKMTAETVDLSDIRNEYGIEEDKDEEDEDDDDWIPSVDDFEQEIAHGYRGVGALRVEAKDEEDEDDDDWIPSVDDFEQEIAHGYRGRGALKVEGFSSDSDLVLAKAGSGELDIYDVMTNPNGPAEVTAAKIIQQMYDDVAIDHGLHPDDDFEKILDIVADQLAADYGDSDADVREATNPYAVGMSQAMKSTGDRPPLKKSTIKKGHKIAKAVAKNEAVEEDRGGSVDAVANSITRRIMSQHMDLLSKYGPVKVMAAIDEVAEFAGADELDEIGSSDVSIWTKQVVQDLEAGHYDHLDEGSADDAEYGDADADDKRWDDLDDDSWIPSEDEFEQEELARLRELAGVPTKEGMVDIEYGVDPKLQKLVDIGHLLRKTLDVGSGVKWDDADFNKAASLADALISIGSSFGPKSLKDALKLADVDITQAQDLIAKASNKTNEAGQVDEISKKTKMAYLNKAADSLADAEDDRDFYLAHDDNTDDEDNTIRKRTAGIDRAEKSLNQVINPRHYVVTYEESKFGGYRPKILNRKNNTTMYLGQHGYKNILDAIKHAELYLDAYANGGDGAATDATMAFVRKNKDKIVSGLGEKAKPDFLDLDDDGNTDEPMKKAADDKIDETANKAVDAAMAELRKLAGL